LINKAWKCRLEAYSECLKLFQTAEDGPRSPVSAYLSLIKKFPQETMEVARDKALEAVLAYIENIPSAVK
jgi:hypothetical protein